MAAKSEHCDAAAEEVASVLAITLTTSASMSLVTDSDAYLSLPFLSPQWWNKHHTTPSSPLNTLNWEVLGHQLIIMVGTKYPETDLAQERLCCYPCLRAVAVQSPPCLPSPIASLLLFSDGQAMLPSLHH